MKYKSLFLLLSCSAFACVGDTIVTGDGGNDATTSDAPSDVGSSDVVTTDGGDAGPFTPQTLDQANQLALWLEASSANITISNGHVGQWTDLSKNHNNATNANGGPDVDSKVLNNHDAVLFSASGVTLSIAASPTLDFAKDQFLIMAVARDTATDSVYFFSKVRTVCISGCQFSTGLEFYATRAAVDGGMANSTALHWAEDTTDAGNVLSASAAWGSQVFDTSFHVVGARRTDVSHVVLFVDGQTQTFSMNALDVSAAGKAALIGAIKYGNIGPQPVTGDIAELVVVHGGIIADQTVTDLYSYFKTKYAL